MTAIQSLTERLEGGGIVILDGAIGTELERVGAPMDHDLWCAIVTEDHPELVSRVHRSYLDAGADVITANTFSSGRHALENAGAGDKVAAWNKRSVELAMTARDECSTRPVCIAGSVSVYGLFDKSRPEAELKRCFREQADILISAGVDLIILELLAATDAQARSAIEALAGVDVPVWVSLSCRVEPDGAVMHGTEESPARSYITNSYGSFAHVIEQVMGVGGSALLMMHSYLDSTVAALEVMRAHYSGSLGAYPNAGYWNRPNWVFVDEVSPEKYADEARRWVQHGAQILGGCCGVGPAQIGALREAFPD